MQPLTYQPIPQASSAPLTKEKLNLSARLYCVLYLLLVILNEKGNARESILQQYTAESDLGVYVCGHGKLTLTSNTNSSEQALVFL